MSDHSVQAMRGYDQWFSATPDPWETVARLEPGGDHTAATTLQSTVLQSAPEQWPPLEKKLLALLQRPDATDTARMFACRMLGLVGSSAAVPTLVPLLRETRTADIARYALDAIDSRAVDEAYRAALGVLTGPPKAGLIGSIALRRDVQALGAIEAIARDPAEPPDVRTAAGHALERLTANDRSATQ